MPLEERRYKEIDEGFGESGGQSAKICNDIMIKTGKIYITFICRKMTSYVCHQF